MYWGDVARGSALISLCSRAWLATHYKGIMKICGVSYKFAFPGDIL